MARSSLFSALRQIAAATAREHQMAMAGPSRRSVLRGAASLAAVAAAPMPLARAADARVAIIGAGLAGLTAAWALSKAGIKADLFEGSTRVGGRCYSIRSFPGQIAEHGGEFIDSDHKAIKALAEELGLTLDDVLAAQPAGTTELYRFGHAYSLAEAKKDYRALYPVVQAQTMRIGSPSYSGSTAFARALDHISAADWVARTVPGGRSSKLGQLIENAISEEYAADVTAMSGLVPPGAFASAPKDDFNLYYTDSDQRYHVRGGNDQIATLLAARLGDRIQTGTALVGLTRLADGRMRVELSRDSAVIGAPYDRVILALPFSVLRSLDLSRAGFRPLKRRAIERLGMGSSMKVQLRFSTRPWLSSQCNGEIRLPSQYFQTTWEVTRAQPGDSGILNFWSGGQQADRSAALDPAELARRCLADAETVLPGLSAGWTGEMTRDYWRRNPWSLGSYSYYPIGFATTLGGIEAEAEGACHFAGEHTSDRSGYLDAAVTTGERAAREVVAALG